MRRALGLLVREIAQVLPMTGEVERIDDRDGLPQMLERLGEEGRGEHAELLRQRNEERVGVVAADVAGVFVAGQQALIHMRRRLLVAIADPEEAIVESFVARQL